MTSYNVKFVTTTPGYWLKSGTLVVEGADIKQTINAIEEVFMPSILVTSVSEVMG